MRSDSFGWELDRISATARRSCLLSSGFLTLRSFAMRA